MIKDENVKRIRNKMETVENEKCVFCKIVSGKDEKTNILHSVSRSSLSSAFIFWENTVLRYIIS